MSLLDGDGNGGKDTIREIVATVRAPFSGWDAVRIPAIWDLKAGQTTRITSKIALPGLVNLVWRHFSVSCRLKYRRGGFQEPGFETPVSSEAIRSMAQKILTKRSLLEVGGKCNQIF